MKHYDHVPDITGPLEGERYLVVLGHSKPEKYLVKKAQHNGVELCAFAFPNGKVAATFQLAPQHIVETPITQRTVELLAAGQAANRVMAFPSTLPPRQTDSDEAYALHSDGECDSLTCPFGAHYCDDCGSDVSGALRLHICTSYCDTHDLEYDMDSSCIRCDEDNSRDD